MTRVLHIISGIDPKYGGPTAALNGLAESQAAAGLGVTVAFTYRERDDISSGDILRGRGVETHAIGPCHGALSRHPRIRPDLERLIMESDVVHVHALWEEIQHQACRVAQRHARPYLIRSCGMLDPWSLSQSRWKKRFYMFWRLRRNLDRAAAIHCVTEMEARMVAKLGLAAPTIVESNGILLPEFRQLPLPGTFRDRTPTLKGRRYIAFLGRVHPQKGFEFLIPALARLADKSTMLVIIGPAADNYKATLDRMIRDAGLTDRVHFTGHLAGADKVAALADADLFVLPSFHENFGVVVIESLAAGVPVVVSDQVYLHPEISATGVGGVFPLDVDRLVAELDRWLGDEALRREARLRAKPFVEERYDWARIARRWDSRYRELMAASRSPARARARH